MRKLSSSLDVFEFWMKDDVGEFVIELYFNGQTVALDNNDLERIHGSVSLRDILNTDLDK